MLNQNQMNGAVLGGLVAMAATFSSAASSVRVLEQPAGAVDGQIDRMFQNTSLGSENQIIVTDFIGQERSTIRLEDNGVSITSDIEVESFFDEVNAGRVPVTAVRRGDPATDVSPAFVFSIDQPHRFEFGASFNIGGEGEASASIFRLPEAAAFDRFDLEDEARVVAFSFNQAGSTSQGVVVDGVGFGSFGSGLDRDFSNRSLGVFEGVESFEDFLVTTSLLESLDLSPFLNQGSTATGVLEAGTFVILPERRNFTGGTFGRTSSAVSLSFSATLIESDPPVVVPTPTAAAAGIIGLGVAGRRRRRGA